MELVFSLLLRFLVIVFVSVISFFISSSVYLAIRFTTSIEVIILFWPTSFYKRHTCTHLFQDQWRFLVVVWFVLTIHTFIVRMTNLKTKPSQTRQNKKRYITFEFLHLFRSLSMSKHNFTRFPLAMHENVRCFAHCYAFSMPWGLRHFFGPIQFHTGSHVF